MHSLFRFTLPVIISLLIRTDAKTYSAVELNRKNLTDLYRTHVLTRPLMKNFSHITIAIGLGIIEVSGIDPQRQEIRLNVNFELKWCDENLQWNTTEQTCLRRNRSEMLFSADEIWTPDIHVLNGPSTEDKEVKLRYPILAICNGIIRWSYQQKLIAFCEVNVIHFPFDRQHCTILLQSTIYDSSQLKLRSLYNVVRLYNYINTEWTISHAKIDELNLYNTNHQNNFSTLKIELELNRFSRFYVLKIIIPFIIISSLAVFSFCLPTDSGEKVALTVSVLLSLTIYLQLISDYIPKTERGICTLTLFSNLMFLLVFLSCIFNIFTIFVYYHEQNSYQRNLPRRKKSVLFTVHQSLIELNKQRWTFLRKRQNIQNQLPEHTDIDAVELLHDIRSFRQSITNMFQRRNSMIRSPSMSLSTFEFRHPLFYPQSKVKRSMKTIAMFIDKILFVVYLILVPMSILILIHSSKQSYLDSLKRTNTTNQLIDIRKATTDPVATFRGCPT